MSSRAPVGWFAAYLLVGLPVVLVQPEVGVSPWYPPVAVGVAWLLLRGRRWWPMVLVAESVVALVQFGELPAGLLSAAVTCAEAVLAATLLRRWRFDPDLGRPEEVPKLLVVAAASAGAAALVGAPLVSRGEGVVDSALVWFVGDLTGMVVLVPILVLCGGRPLATFRRLNQLPPRRRVEAALAAAAALAVAAFTFGQPDPGSGPAGPVDVAAVGPLLLSLLPVLWVAIRFGRIRTAGLVAAVNAVAFAALLTHDHLGAPVDDGELLGLQSFMVVLSATALFVAVAVDALRLASARQAAILDASPTAVVALDLDRRVTLWNRTAERIFGWSASEVAGRELPAVPPGGRAAFLERGAEQLRGPTSRVLEYVRRDGTPLEARISTNPLRSSDGDAVGVVGVIEDLTEVVAARREQTRLAADLVDEREDRRAVNEALADVRDAGTPEATATALCAAATRIDGIVGAVLYAERPGGGLERLGGVLPGGHELPVEPVPEVAAALRRLADGGVWSLPFEATQWAASPHATRLAERGLRAIGGAPLQDGDRRIGLLVVGTAHRDGVEWLGRRHETLTELAAHAAVLLAPTLAAREAQRAARDKLVDTIEQRRFHPVFQPVVSLADGAVVGVEALTRFDDGRPPDVVFAEAVAVGVDHDLERACLREALVAAPQLPEGVWLSINASPSWLLSGEVAGLVTGGARPLVVEVTEHREVEDYAALARALAELAGVRVSVDDAGAGYASLRHILELRPDLVKLDIGLIRGIDADPARQAIVAGMRHFADETGTVLVAEGVETDAEADAVRALGVELAQGYLFGRPAPLPHPDADT